MALPYAALSHQDEVVVPPDELAAGQLLDAGPVDRLGVELPVERRQRLAVAEACLADSVGDAPLAALGRLLSDQAVQEFQVREAIAFDLGPDRVERFGTQWHLQGLKVGQDALTQVHRRGRTHRAFRAAGHGRAPWLTGVDSRRSDGAARPPRPAPTATAAAQPRPASGPDSWAEPAPPGCARPRPANRRRNGPPAPAPPRRRTAHKIG